MNWWEKEEFSVNTTPSSSAQEDWDIYFLRMAKLVATRSKCASRQIGSVLVRDHQILTQGWNGASMGSSLCQGAHLVCPRKTLGFGSGGGMEICPAAHSEANCIYMAARLGISTLGTTLYAHCGIPCKNCAVALINAGVKKVVCLYRERDYDALGPFLIREAIELVRYDEEKV